jgi:hypothetical protein
MLLSSVTDMLLLGDNQVLMKGEVSLLKMAWSLLGTMCSWCGRECIFILLSVLGLDCS